MSLHYEQYVQMYANMYKYEQYVKIYIYVQQVHL